MPSDIPDHRLHHRKKPYDRRVQTSSNDHDPSVESASIPGSSRSRAFYYIIPKLWSKCFSYNSVPSPPDALLPNAFSLAHPQSTPTLGPAENSLLEPFMNVDPMSSPDNNFSDQHLNGMEDESSHHLDSSDFSWCAGGLPSATASLGQNLNAEAGPSHDHNSGHTALLPFAEMDPSGQPLSNEEGIFHHLGSSDNGCHTRQPSSISAQFSGQPLDAEVGPLQFEREDNYFLDTTTTLEAKKINDTLKVLAEKLKMKYPDKKVKVNSICSPSIRTV